MCGYRDFTRLSSHADLVEVVKVLNDIFSDFDDLTKQHGLEKIKTIGDAYMEAGGLPVTREDHLKLATVFPLFRQVHLKDGQPELSL